MLKMFLCSFFSLCTLSVYGGHYAQSLCKTDGFTCYQVQPGDRWEHLIQDPEDQMMLKKLNRTNTQLKHHRVIALPKWERSSLYHFSPMPYYIDHDGEKRVVISLKDHAFGAYDESGELIKWGPISGGRGYCPDTQSYCRTVQGEFKIYRMGHAGCKSGKYPLETKGGAPMPYCMFFHRGYAIHGSTLPGYHASHGCVRVFDDDAQWLNQEFVEHGTQVHVVDRL